jgi:hypothetical protein
MPDLTASKKVTDALDKELQAALKSKAGKDVISTSPVGRTTLFQG